MRAVVEVATALAVRLAKAIKGRRQFLLVKVAVVITALTEEMPRESQD